MASDWSDDDGSIHDLRTMASDWSDDDGSIHDLPMMASDWSDDYGSASDDMPTVAKSGGFTFDLRDGLRYKEFKPESLADLRRLLRSNASKKHGRQRATKPWVSAQLRLFDIPFKASGSADDLKSTLQAAVKAGKCNNIPATIAAKETTLRKKLDEQREQHERKQKKQHDDDFNSLSSPSDEFDFDLKKFLLKYFVDEQGKPAPQKQHEALILHTSYCRDDSRAANKIRAIPGLKVQGNDLLVVVGWQGSSFLKGLDDAFAMMSAHDFGLHTQTREANFDTERFLAKYFLTGLKGQPDKKKTPEPLELWTLMPTAEAAIREAAQSIPGLHVADWMHGYGSHSIVIGWGSHKVATFVKRKDAEDSRKKEEERRQQEARELAECEEELERKTRKRKEYAKKHRPHAGPLKLEHIVGSYAVECEKMEGYGSDELALDIQPPTSTFGTTAAFNFGMLEGVMLMALSEDALEKLRQEIEDAEKEFEYGCSQEDDEEEDDRDEDDRFYGSSSTSKRKATSKTGANGQTIKRRLGETPRPNRIYYRWRGSETGTAEIQQGQEEDHVGHFDFENNGLTAVGVFVHPNFFGKEKMEIKIYKEDDSPQNEPEAWSSFSQKQWDYHCSAR